VTECHLLSAGAAQDVVISVRSEFEMVTGVTLQPVFAPVGVLRERIVAGEPCDVMITSEVHFQPLVDAGYLNPDTRSDLGRVSTSVAVRIGNPVPDIGDADAVREAILAASTIYCSDPERSTGGSHTFAVLDRLGVAATVADRISVHPNGATAMQALAADNREDTIGFAQSTEVLYTDGVQLIGPLPSPIDRVTTYLACAASGDRVAAAAAVLIDLVAGPGTRSLRSDAGFQQLR
jgi:molybdate transport system substrate-binding protein